MVRVQDILPEAKKILGNHDLGVIFRRLTDAVEILANKGDFDPLVGTMDICTSGRIVTLPSEVETVLAVNMVGQPALARDELFQFHLNGPGTCGPAIRYEWMDMSESPVFRELKCPATLRAYAIAPEDENAELWVYGFDANQNYVRTDLGGGAYRDGWKVPVFVGVGTSVPGAPVFARITAIQKAVTRGPIRLTAVQDSEETLIGLYQSYETSPKFRRIQLSECVPWVRIRFRRRTFAVRSEYDLLPVGSAPALLMMLKALKAYDTPGGLAEGEAYEATAMRWLLEEQHSRSAPVVHPVQVSDAAALLTPEEALD